MAEHNAFEKLHVDERDKADLGGVLEQLNLPPKMVEFVRKYQRTIIIVLACVAAAVVFWSLYGSYAENRHIDSSTALSVAEKKQGPERRAALQAVIDEYESTDAARWAKIDLARMGLADGDAATALGYYREVRQSVDQDNPLRQLLTFAIAQALEEQEQYDEALKEYETLKNSGGYEHIGYSGVARIYEIQGKTEQAIYEYEQYLGTLTEPSGGGERAYITEKLSQLKASL